MKKFEDLFGMSWDIALRKKRAGEARFGHEKPSGEKPRDVFRAGCEEIVSHFAAEGFTFAKSSHTAKRKRDDLTDEILFQSSHNNVGGEYVAMWIHPGVLSRRMKEWREAHPYPGSIVHDRIAGAQIGNLQPKPAWLEWNLAVRRDEQIASAVEMIRNVALPFFELFTDLGALASTLADRGDIPGFSTWQAIEFLLCFSSREMADRALASFFRRRADLLAAYREALPRLAAEGVPDYLGDGYAKDLAKATIVFGLTPA